MYSLRIFITSFVIYIVFIEIYWAPHLPNMVLRSYCEWCYLLIVGVLPSYARINPNNDPVVSQYKQISITLLSSHHNMRIALPHNNTHNALPAKWLSGMWVENDDHPAYRSEMYLSHLGVVISSSILFLI